MICVATVIATWCVFTTSLHNSSCNDVKDVEEVVYAESNKTEHGGESKLDEVETESEPLYSDEELDMLSRIIFAEAGSDWITDEHRLAVGSVVLNRVADSRFPNTMREVVFQKGQYACTWDGNYNKTPNERAINNARYLLENGVTIPTNIVWQSQDRQGKGLWKKIQTHYFCY